VNIGPARQLARIAAQFPDLKALTPYQRVVWTIRATLLRCAPNVTVGTNAKIDCRFYYPAGLFLEIGADAHIKRDVRVGWEAEHKPGSQLKIGSGTEVLSGTQLDCTGGIHIGNNSHIGRRSTIYSHRHEVDQRDVPVLKAPITIAPVVIGNDVMIYSEVVVLPGVTIGDGAVIAVRAVVTEDVAPYTKVGGIPAKTIGKRT
jgi:acetyltransferase-like isoleucine patch superfamily enzyme